MSSKDLHTLGLTQLAKGLDSGEFTSVELVQALLERIKAFVVLRDGYEGKVTVNDIVSHCKEKLAPYAVPKMVEFRESLPLTVTEKLFKKQLRDEEIRKLSKE